MLEADLSGLDLVALMIDGVHFGEHLCVVALGISIDGVKHPLGLAEGSTENTAVVTDLLTGLRERGLDTTRAIFVGLDGGKALHAAVVRVFSHPVIGRCQLHKIRNVTDKLPDRLAVTVTTRMRKAYHAESALHAEAQLEALAKELDRTHPGAAGSLREGLAETLTVLRLNVAPTLARTLRSTKHRVDDLHRPHPLGQREELAKRHHGTALVRRRDDRSPRPVPLRQRTPAPTRATRRPRRARHRPNCRCRASS